MKTLNLDIKSKNVNIGQVEKCDTVKLVATLEEKDYSNSIIRILGKKADKTFVEQIVEATGNKVEVTLKKQFTTCEGIARIEINVVTGEEEWTSNENYFYVSSTINNDVVSSSNDVETLEEVKKYVTSAASDLKQFEVIKNDLAVANETMKNDELLRKGNELLRTDKEAVRIKNEFTRTTSEEEREANELLRVENENTRKVNENNRKINEISRTENENARILAEKQRQESFEAKEEIRNENENTRIKTESERKKHFESAKTFEEGRKTGENVRISSENIRFENEETRKTNEVARQKAEENREATYSNFNEAEIDRKASETSRKANEVARINAESERDSKYLKAENDRDNAFSENEEVRSIAFTTSELNRRNTFAENEETRGVAFTQAENVREQAEVTRVANETSRKNAETSRVNVEKTRVVSENSRVNAENVRKTSETSRVDAENLRVVAEENRETVVNEIKNAQSEIDATLFEMTKEVKEARGDKETLKLKLIDMENRAAENVAKQYLEASTDTGSLKVENCYNGLTKDLNIKGKTLQNLAPKNGESGGSSSPSTEINGTATKVTATKAGSLVVTYKPKFDFKDNTDYTVIFNLSTDLDMVKMSFRNDVSYVQGEVTMQNPIKSQCFKLRTTTNCSQFVCGWHSSIAIGKYIETDSLIILEGDHTANPPTNWFNEIKSLGEEENKISILSCGKNLLKPTDKEKILKNTNKPEVTIKTDGSYVINGTSTASGGRLDCFNSIPNTILKKGITYKLSGYVEGLDGLFMTRLSDNKAVLDHLKPYTPAQDEECVFGINYKPTTYNNLIIKPQLEENTMATACESYKEDKKDILLPVQFGAKGLPSGVCDEAYWNGDYFQKIARKGLNDFDVSAIQLPNLGVGIVLGIADGNKAKDSDLMCNKYKKGNVNIVESIYNNPSNFVIVKPSGYTVEQFKVDDSDIEIYYELKTPILHKATVPTNNNMTTFKDITHISCLNKIAPSSMSAKFPVDLPATISRLTMENKGLLQENVELSNKAEKLIIENECQQIDIDTNMVATVELFEMMINVTANTKYGIKGNDGMVEVYVSLIIKGKKKLEDVPMIIRPQVEQQLKDLGIIV